MVGLVKKLVGLFLDRAGISAAGHISFDTIICSKNLKEEAQKLCENVIVLSGKPCSVYQELMTGYSESLRNSTLENTINDSFKFFINPTIEIFEILESYRDSTIYCFGGSNWSSLSVVSGDNVESSRAVLTSKKYFINLMVSQWCNNNDVKLEWLMSSDLSMQAKFLIRCAYIFASTFFLTVTGKSSAKFLHSKGSKKAAVYRKIIQKNILEDFTKKYHSDDFGISQISSKGNFINVCKRFVYLTYLSVKSLVEVFNLLVNKNKNIIQFKYKNDFYEFNAIPSMVENILLLDEKLYALDLSKYIALNKIEELYSCEMTSRFAFIEKNASEILDAKSVGIQAGLVSSIVVPKFPVHNKFVAMSFAECRSLLNLYNDENIHFYGPIRNYKSITNVKVDLLIVSQPYAQDVIQLVIDLVCLEYPHITCKFRKHPRDSFSYKMRSKCIIIDSNLNCIDSIMESKVVIGMTTTVLEDAINADKKVIVVCMDEYTKSIVGRDMDPSKIHCESIEQLNESIKKALFI